MPIWIGVGEGNALASQLREHKTVRPLTYDLMTELVRTLGAQVERAAIIRLEDATFYASVRVDGRDLDARPSDAFNVAVRIGAPIVAAPEVLDNSGVVGEAELLAELEPQEGSSEQVPGAWRSLSSDLLAEFYKPPV